MSLIFAFLLFVSAEQETILQDQKNREEFLLLKERVEGMKKKVGEYADILRKRAGDFPAAETEEEKAHPEVVGRRGQILRKLKADAEEAIPLLQKRFDELVREAENVYLALELQQGALKAISVSQFTKTQKQLFREQMGVAKKLMDLNTVLFHFQLSVDKIKRSQPPDKMTEKEEALEAALFPPETPP